MDKLRKQIRTVAGSAQRRREASHVPLDPKGQRLVLFGAMPRGLAAGQEVGAGHQRISQQKFNKPKSLRHSWQREEQTS